MWADVPSGIAQSTDTMGPLHNQKGASGQHQKGETVNVSRLANSPRLPLVKRSGQLDAASEAEEICCWSCYK